MWAPGTYLPDRGEGAAVHANIGVEKYFFEAGDQILNRIKEVRSTAILPERTGPIADVLYSAAGNSADEHWYNRGVIAYSFETGADRFVDQTTLSVASAAGATGIRSGNRNMFSAGEKVDVDAGTAERGDADGRLGRRRRTRPARTRTCSSPSPRSSRTRSERSCGAGSLQSGVGFQPDYETEGKFEALEFAAGNYGLLESAFEYAKDDKGPEVVMTGPRRRARRSRRRSST